MALTTFGQDFKAANRLTATQVSALDEMSAIGNNGRVETDADALDLLNVYMEMSTRTRNSLWNRGLIDERGLTGHGHDVLMAHI